VEAHLMPVLPEIQEFLKASAAAPPPDPRLSIAGLREAAHRGVMRSFGLLTAPGAEIASIEERQIAVAGGSIRARIYTPRGDDPFPAHVYLHGGGFWMGAPELFDPQCQDLAAGAGCVVVSIDYRLAPEHKFPVPLEDCYAGLLWTAAHARELGIDASRLSVGGGSAGGGLSASVALLARDLAGPKLALQVLEIPVTDLTMSQPSVRENGEGYMLTRQGMAQCVGYYLARPEDARNPHASPLFAPDLSDLPPALVMTAEFDPLRDEGEAYARRLAQAGVTTTLRRWRGHIHGSMGFTKVLPSAREYRDQIAAALRHALAAAPS
jgi:acetyl esterase